MAFNLEHLITRQTIIDRTGEPAFILLESISTEYDAVMPFMLRLSHVERPQSVYFIPLTWVQDDILFKKLTKDMVFTTPKSAINEPPALRAKEAGFRLAVLLEEDEEPATGVDFIITPWHSNIHPTPSTVYTGIETEADATAAQNSAAMYFTGQQFTMGSAPASGAKRINPSHALILELMSAVQQEAEPKVIEALFKRDIALSFKLLRYINSPWFGLVAQVESVRHALTIIGNQQLMKWLSLLVINAGQHASAAFTHTAMVRAKLMEQIGAKVLDKRETDNLFVTGMLSLLDRVIGVPMENILKHVNLPSAVIDTLRHEDSRYRRFMALALACEGHAIPEDIPLDDIDVKSVNMAHLEAMEWAMQSIRNVSA